MFFASSVFSTTLAPPEQAHHVRHPSSNINDTLPRKTGYLNLFTGVSSNRCSKLTFERLEGIRLPAFQFNWLRTHVAATNVASCERSFRLQILEKSESISELKKIVEEAAERLTEEVRCTIGSFSRSSTICIANMGANFEAEL